MVFWGFEDYGAIRIGGLRFPEDLTIKVFWGFKNYGTLRIWGLSCFKDFRILQLWSSEDLED